MITSFKTLFLYFVLMACLPSYVMAQLTPLPSAPQNSSSFNFSQWPKTMTERFYSEIPELKIQYPNEQDLDIILKRAFSLYSFDDLKIVKSQDKYYLVGTITSQVQEIEFVAPKQISKEELQESITLSLSDALNESKVEQAIQKLVDVLKNKGYRNPQVKSEYQVSDSVHKKLVFKVLPGVQTKISQIEIQGLPQPDKESLEKNLFWVASGKVLTEDVVKETQAKLRSLLSQSGYFLVNIPTPQIFFSADDSKARLLYRFANKNKYKVEIIGSRKYSETHLYLDVLKLDNYFASESNFGAELSEKLRQFYNEHGYDLAEINYFERKEKDRIVLTLNVDEGPRVYIDQVQIQGQLSRSEQYYRDRFYSLSSLKVQDKLLVRDDIEKAAKNLITSLQNEGYVSARLKRLQFTSETQKPHAGIIILQIDEGLPTLIQKITFAGNKSMDAQALLKATSLQPGEKLNLTQLETGIFNLKRFYADHGHIEIKVLNDAENKSQNAAEDFSHIVKYNQDYTEAELHFDIQEGPQVHVSSIVLEGNQLTRDKIIFTELDFKQGDILTPSKIQESSARLQKTGLFSSIEITTLEANTDQKDRTVLVKVFERKPILITAGIGATNENERTFHAYLGAAHRNLGGWGRGLSSRAEIKYNDVFLKFLEHKITLGYLEPYLFDTRARFRVNYTAATSVTDVNLRKQTIENSAVWAVEQDFTSHLTGIWDIYNISNYVEKGIKPQDEIDHNYSSQDFVIASTGPTVDIDYRDNIINPTSGSFSRFSVEYASHFLGNNKVDDFARMSGQTTWYFPFAEKQIVWANSLRGGYIKPVGSTNEGIPYDKRGFNLGGRSTIRGYESTEFFPSTNPKNPENIGTSYRLKTPASFQLIKSELRFPLMPKYDLSAAVFYDGGQIIIDGMIFDDQYRDSVGIGLRYATPVGPLSLEYAHKLDKKPYESEGAFHLSVGVF